MAPVSVSSNPEITRLEYQVPEEGRVELSGLIVTVLPSMVMALFASSYVKTASGTSLVIWMFPRVDARVPPWYLITISVVYETLGDPFAGETTTHGVLAAAASKSESALLSFQRRLL